MCISCLHLLQRKWRFVFRICAANIAIKTVAVSYIESSHNVRFLHFILINDIHDL